MRPSQWLRRPFAGLLLTIATVVGFPIWRPDTAAAILAATLRKAAPDSDFTLQDSTGAPVTLSSFRGRVLVLDVWATWCTGCKVEIPWYIQFQRAYAKHGLATLGVAMDEEGWKTVTPYLEQHPITFPVVVSDAVFSRNYAVTAMPVTLLIDRKGRVADWHVGLVVKSAWEKEIRILLQEK